MKHLWKWFLAYFHLDDAAVCQLSVGRDEYHDYHDYSDDAIGLPLHFTLLRCRRCHKGFYI